MAAKMRGIQQAIKRTQQIVGEITGEKAVSAIKAATYIIRTESASMTPVATSALINSQFDTVEVNGTRITGKIGYAANYALYVHNAPGEAQRRARE
jgi:DNA-binding transcriptional regulator WhiA